MESLGRNYLHENSALYYLIEQMWKKNPRCLELE